MNKYSRLLCFLFVFCVANICFNALAMPGKDQDACNAAGKTKPESAKLSQKDREMEMAGKFMDAIRHNEDILSIRQFDWTRLYPLLREYILPHDYFYLINHPDFYSDTRVSPFVKILYALAYRIASSDQERVHKIIRQRLYDNAEDSKRIIADKNFIFLSPGHALLFLLKKIDLHIKYNSLMLRNDKYDYTFSYNYFAVLSIGKALENTSGLYAEIATFPEGGMGAEGLYHAGCYFASYISPYLTEKPDEAPYPRSIFMEVMEEQAETVNNYQDLSFVLKNQQGGLSSSITEAGGQSGSCIHFNNFPSDPYYNYASVLLIRTRFEEWFDSMGFAPLKEEVHLRKIFATYFVSIYKKLKDSSHMKSGIGSILRSTTRDEFLDYTLDILNFNPYSYLDSDGRKLIFKIISETIDRSSLSHGKCGLVGCRGEKNPVRLQDIVDKIKTLYADDQVVVVSSGRYAPLKQVDNVTREDDKVALTESTENNSKSKV